MQFKEHEPPEHLSGRAKAIWARLVPHSVRAFGRIALLQSALECLDTADRARAEMAATTLTTKTLGSGTIHAHPLLKVEKEARAQFTSIMGALGLNNHNYDGGSLDTWLRWQEAKQ